MLSFPVTLNLRTDIGAWLKHTVPSIAPWPTMPNLQQTDTEKKHPNSPVLLTL